MEMTDRFVAGGSLSRYFVVGNPAPFLSPSGNLRMLSTKHGTQIIGLAGYILSDGALTIEAQLRLRDIGDVTLFFGLTGQNTELQLPAGENGVGFLYEGGNIRFGEQDSGVSFVADTRCVLRLALDEGGNAQAYIEGVLVGQIAAAVAPDVMLYPTIYAAAHGTSREARASYLYVHQAEPIAPAIELPAVLEPGIFLDP